MIEQKDILLILQCAPVIIGVKSSNAIIVSEEKKEWIQEAIQESSISCLNLYQSKKDYFIFLYRKKQLQHYLERAEIIDFLKNFGYKNFELEKLFSDFIKKFAQYKKGQTQFPHELGIFLEYPMEDVKGFLQYYGKNSLFTGYWRVYQNPARAIQIFNEYNKAKLTVAKDFVKGKSLKEIVCEYGKEKD